MLKLRVKSVTWEAEGILSYELVDPAGLVLPAFEAGAHLDVALPGGLIRQYSLCDPPWQRDHYRIAVLDVANGRGGSRAMHENVRAGMFLDVSPPRNLFPLAPDAGHSILLAGGIGITPLMAMLEELRRAEKSYELHYCTTRIGRTAFAMRLAREVEAGRAHLHHDGGDPGKGLDLARLLRAPADGTHVYYCGPAGFMAAAERATAHWSPGTVHFEYFGATPAAPAAAANGAAAGEVFLTRSQRTIAVPAGSTILQALREAGVECASSCEAGMCGTCRTTYTSGSLEHNDLLLSDEERAREVLICCARIAGGPVHLDL